MFVCVPNATYEFDLCTLSQLSLTYVMILGNKNSLAFSNAENVGNVGEVEIREGETYYLSQEHSM